MVIITEIQISIQRSSSWVTNYNLSRGRSVKSALDADDGRRGNCCGAIPGELHLEETSYTLHIPLMQWYTDTMKLYKDVHCAVPPLPSCAPSGAGKDKSGDKLLQRRDWFRCTKHSDQKYH